MLFLSTCPALGAKSWDVEQLAFSLCWAWDAHHEHELMHTPSSFLFTSGHWSFEAEFSKSQNHSFLQQLSARCCSCQDCTRGIRHLLVWLGSDRDLLFLPPLPASVHTELTATEITCSTLPPKWTSLPSTGNNPFPTCWIVCLIPWTMLELRELQLERVWARPKPIPLAFASFSELWKSGIIIPLNLNTTPLPSPWMSRHYCDKPMFFSYSGVKLLLH